MGVRDSLYNIDYELTQQTKLLKQDKELKKLEAEYKRDIISASEQVFYDRFENAKITDYKKCYNFFILNKEEYIEYIISVLNDVDTYRVNFELSMYEDVKKQYYKTLKEVYTEYSLGTSANNEELLELFEANLRKLFQTQDYDVCINFLYDVETRQTIIDTLGTTKAEKRYLDNIYTKEVNKYAAEYKKYQKKQPIQKASKQVAKKNSLGAITPLCLIGGAIFGVGRGFYRASKK